MALLALAPALWRRARGAGWRVLSFAVLGLALANPRLVEETRETRPDIALLDAKKGLKMFEKVGVPILGIVENMAVHICSNCGHAEHLFGEGGGEKLAAQFGVELLASMPLSIAIRTQADSGRPTVIADPESQLAMLYQEIARHVGARIVLSERASVGLPNISISDD